MNVPFPEVSRKYQVNDMKMAEEKERCRRQQSLYFGQFTTFWGLKKTTAPKIRRSVPLELLFSNASKGKIYFSYFAMYCFNFACKYDSITIFPKLKRTLFSRYFAYTFHIHMLLWYYWVKHNQYESINIIQLTPPTLS